MNKSNCIREAYPLLVRLFCFSIALLILAACEKTLAEDERDKEGGSKTITFSVMDIENQSLQPTRAIADLCNRLSLAIYDYYTGEKLMQVDQTNVDEDFGTIAVKLDQGAYRADIIGYTSESAATMTSSSNKAVSFYNNIFTDVFYYTNSFTLGPANGTLNVNLKRATSVVRLEITGDMPSDAYRLDVRFCSPSLYFNPKTGLGCARHKMTFKKYFKQDVNTYDYYVFAMDSPQTLDSLVFTAYTNQEKVLRRLTYVKKIDIAPNTLTLIKGDFFKTQLKSAISITDNWDSINEYAIPNEDEIGQP